MTIVIQGFDDLHWNNPRKCYSEDVHRRMSRKILSILSHHSRALSPEVNRRAFRDGPRGGVYADSAPVGHCIQPLAVTCIAHSIFSPFFSLGESFPYFFNPRYFERSCFIDYYSLDANYMNVSFMSGKWVGVK